MFTISISFRLNNNDNSIMSNPQPSDFRGLDLRPLLPGPLDDLSIRDAQILIRDHIQGHSSSILHENWQTKYGMNYCIPFAVTPGFDVPTFLAFVLQIFFIFPLYIYKSKTRFQRSTTCPIFVVVESGIWVHVPSKTKLRLQRSACSIFVVVGSWI